MQTKKVSGNNNKHQVLMYAISTCGWCRRAKNFLKDNSVAFEYIDIDLSDEDVKEIIKKDIIKRGGPLAYPTLIIDNKILLTGAPQDKLKEILEL